MQRIRNTNTNDVVPLEYQNRLDFVLNSEMAELCTDLGKRYGFSLDDMYIYYKTKIEKCKHCLTRLEHFKACVDAESFVKIMIDWLVYEQLNKS